MVGKNDRGPLVLVFSPRERIREIITVGLAQSDYRVLQADSSFLSTIKAYQFLPDLVIADITADNTRDILFIPRLRKSVRTKNIPVVLILSRGLASRLDKLLGEHVPSSRKSFREAVHVMEYPFNLAEMQRRVSTIVPSDPSGSGPQGGSGTNDDEIERGRVAKLLYDLETPVQTKLQDIEHSIHRQWVFPFTVIKALDIIESNAGCCSELGRCISTDPGATAAILKVANTVRYARRGKPITEIADAVVRLGFRETRNLLGCLALIDLSPDLEKKYGFSRQEFWLHSLAVALISQKLCAERNHRRPELAFIAGLVHDLGKIPLDNSYHEVFVHLLEETANTVSSFHDTEKRLLGFSHAELGHYLTSLWNFPSTISQAILNHHNPQRALDCQTPFEKIVQCSVYMGNVIAKATAMGHSCDEYLDEIPARMLTDFRMPRGPGDRFFTDIHRHLRLFCEFLGIPPVPEVFDRTERAEQAPRVVMVFGANSQFHPVAPALRSAGYDVRATTQFSRERYPEANAVISITGKGAPLDITLSDEVGEGTTAESNLLKIFLLDSLPSAGPPRVPNADGIVFLDRKHLDLRLVLHILDQHIEARGMGIETGSSSAKSESPQQP